MPSAQHPEPMPSGSESEPYLKGTCIGRQRRLSASAAAATCETGEIDPGIDTSRRIHDHTGNYSKFNSGRLCTHMSMHSYGG